MARRTVDVAIVGAGLSGLAAAQRVEAQGLTACIVEARGRIGGRVVASDVLGAPFDAGAQFLHPNCTEMLALAARHDIEVVSAAGEGALIRSFGGDRQRIDDPATMFGHATAAVFAAIGELQTMMAALPEGAPWAAPQAAEWDTTTFRDWAAARIADRHALDMFLMRPTFDMALGWHNISLLGVLAHMKAGGLEKALGLIVKVPQGAAVLVAALASEVRAEILLDAPVRAIAHDDTGVALRTDSEVVEARAAIVALSPTLADRIAFEPALPRGRTMLQRAWHDRPSTKTMVIYDTPWWNEAGLSGSAVGDRTAAPLVLDGSVPGRPEGVLAVFSTCTADAPEEAAIVADLVHYFGPAAASPRRVVSHDWFAEHWTAGAGSAPPPGLLSRYGPALRDPVGRIFWAGAESATVATYNMEGAITAGQRAGEEVTRYLQEAVKATRPSGRRIAPENLRNTQRKASKKGAEEGKMRKNHAIQASLLALAIAHSAPAAAQQTPVAPADASAKPDEGGLADIIVTASRRATDQQRTPVALNVVGGDMLAAAGTSQAQDLNKSVAGLAISPNGAQTQVFLRGVGAFSVSANSDSAVAVNLDQVFLSFPAQIGSIFYDLSRVEVLKGPQGTLYGRNATAGVINVIPNRPVFDTGVEGALEVGTYNLIKGNLAVNLAASDQIAVRAAGQIVRRDGYLSDGLGDDRSESGRLQLLFKPSDAISLLISGDYGHIGGKGQAFVPVLANGQSANPSNPWEGPSTALSNAGIAAFNTALSGVPFGPVPLTTTNQAQDTDNWGVSAELNVDLGGPMLTVIPAYRSVRSTMRVQPGFTYDSAQDATQTSVEARLSSGSLGGPLKWVLGGYYLDNSITETSGVNQGLVVIAGRVPATTRSLAAFGELTYSITPSIRLTGGLRYTNEKRTQDGSFTVVTIVAPPPVPPITATYGVGGRATFDDLSYKAGIDIDVGPRSIVYATVSSGFKAGGFNADVAPNAFKPEKLTAFTLGSKNRFFDNRLQLNVEAFYWDYKDHQEIRQAALNAGGFAPVVINTGKSRLLGVNLDVNFLASPDDLFTAQVEYLNTKFNDFAYLALPISPAIPGVTTTCAVTPAGPVQRVDCSGKPFPRAPEWSATLGYQHIFHIGEHKIIAAVNSSISSSFFYAVDYIASQRQSSYTMTDLALAWEGPEGRWGLRGYVRNIENTAVYQGGYQQPFLPGVTYATIRPPRTYGVTASFKF